MTFIDIQYPFKAKNLKLLDKSDKNKPTGTVGT